MTRVGWIVVSLLALALPAEGVCGMMAESAEPMDPCAMAAGHDMANCADEVAVSRTCCDPGAAAAATDLVLKRPEEDGGALATASLASAAHVPEPNASTKLQPDPAPPPRLSAYRLFSALLL